MFINSEFIQSKKVDLFLVISAILFSMAIIVYADTSSTQVIVSNATPSLSATTFNNAAAITLTENTTTIVYATTTVTDANGCATIDHVAADFYRTDITESNCDASGEAVNNYCYPDVTCTVEAGTCSGVDTAANYVCSVTLQFYADATDAGSKYASTDWSVTFEAGDGTASSTEDTVAVEMNTLTSLNVDASLDYNTLAANTNTGVVNSTTTVTNTGNEDMDPELSGTTLLTSGSDTIAYANQEYAAAPFDFASAGTDLSGSATQIDLALAKPYSTTTPLTADVSWGIEVDNGQANGTYTGVNTIGAAAGL
jgi:hypothetical protein